MTDKQKKMVEENHNLIYAFLQKYHLPVEEWYGMAAIGLCRAAMTFKENVSSFSTYAYRCMFTAVMQEKRKETHAKTIPNHMIFYYQTELNDSDGNTACFMDFIPSIDDVEGDTIAKVIFEEFNEILKPRDKAVFQMLQDGYTQREIGSMVGCSQTQVSRIKKKFTRYLLD
jgi:RNA polymerase sigma factor (sigma-70 family)